MSSYELNQSATALQGGTTNVARVLAFSFTSSASQISAAGPQPSQLVGLCQLECRGLGPVPCGLVRRVPV